MPRLSVLAFVAVSLLLTGHSTFVSAADTASISGTVKFIGDAPVIENIRFSADPYCERLHKDKPVPRQDVQVNPNQTLKNVLVYVKSGLPAGRTYPTPTTPAVVNQQGCLYTPHVQGIMVNQVVEIRNSDATMHNVNARGGEKQNKPFNFSMVNDKVPTREVKFDKPEVPVRLKCDVHPWMVAFLGVFTHPFFSVSGDDGTFSITGLPAGTYTLEAWHEAYGRGEAQITLTDGQAGEANFAYSTKGVAKP